jgi:glycosyltransferase involved in cell wall biosynthesis
MPRVLRIINRFNIGGPTYNATFLSVFLSDDFETLLVGGLPEPDEEDSLYIPKKYGVKPLLISELQRTPNFKSDRIAYKKLKEIIREFKPDIVHTHASKAGALGRKAALACNVPVIIHTFHGHVFHSYFGRLKTTLFQFIERRLAAKTTKIIAISPLQKEELSAVYHICKPEKISVIPLGFDLEQFQENLTEKRRITRANYQLSENEVAVAIVGRLAPIKNHALFLAVIELLAQKKCTARFFIVGDGMEKEQIAKEVKRLHETFGVSIEMTSWIKDIATFNAGMDVMCLTSNNEGTPVSLIEAQACNLPVVSTDVGGVKDILIPGETGFIVPKNDPNAFARALEKLIESKELRAEMSEKSWTFVKNKFHYRNLVAQTEALYRELLQNKTT